MNKNRVFAAVVVVLAIAAFALAAVFTKKDAESTPDTASDRVDESVLIKPHSYVMGPANAKVTVTEFLDPECEACRAIHPIVKQIQQEYGDRIRVVIRYMPFHGNSYYAASALEEARELGKYEEALGLLFKNQPEWGSHHNPRPELIETYLTGIGMKPEQLKADYLLGKHGKKIDIDQADGYTAGVTGTPTFFVNGRKLRDLGYEPLKNAIEAELQQ